MAYDFTMTPPPTSRDRVAGALLGVHTGDALGAGVEFSSWDQLRQRHPDGPREITGGGPFGWPAGHATDDTDLTRAVLLAYLAPGDDVVRTAADHMLRWFDGDWPGRQPGTPPVDAGAATVDGLRRYRHTGDPRQAGAGPGRAGNGSLMRCIPTALAALDRGQRLRESVEISAVTHDDPRCTVACAAYNEIVAALVSEADVTAAVAVGHDTAAALDVPAVVDSITAGTRLELARLAATGETAAAGLADEGGGFVLDSLTLAVAAVLDPRSLPDALVDVVRVGRDTDTNAAIAGGLLGARDGASAIPHQWRSVLQFGDEFTAAAADLTG